MTRLKKIVSTEDVPERDRLAYWLAAACDIYCTLDFKPPAADTLRGSIAVAGLEGLVLSHVTCNAEAVWHVPARSRTDDESFVALVLLEGEAEIRQQRRSSLLRPGDVVIHNCAEPYQLVFSRSPHVLYGVRLPGEELMRAVPHPHDLTALAVPRSLAPARILKGTLDQLHRSAADPLPRSSEAAMSQALVSMVAAGLRCLPQAAAPAPRRLAAYHLARVREHVRRHLADPQLSVSTIAAAVGLSPDHVRRLFRGQPSGLMEWVWQERLEACRNALRDPRLASRSVSEIAYAWGFSDPAHFSRRFRQMHGMSPLEWRRREPAGE